MKCNACDTCGKEGNKPVKFGDGFVTICNYCDRITYSEKEKKSNES